MGKAQSKEYYFKQMCTYQKFLCWFSSKKFVIVIFISFFYEISNFRNRILTNQTPELVKRICHMEKLLSATLIICSSNTLLFEMRILPLKIFIQTTLSLAEIESNKCLPIFIDMFLLLLVYCIYC